MCIKEIHWKKASEQLPKQSCDVVVITTSGWVATVGYSDRYKKFNAHDYSNNNAFEEGDVVYWEYAEEVLPNDIIQEVEQWF